MATFEIDGKEYELKITFDAVKRLNKAFEGGSFEVIGSAIAGDFDAFPVIIHAALLHTKEGITLKAVNKAIEEAFESESLTLDDMLRIGNEVILESFFYKPTVTKLEAQRPEVAVALKQIRG